MSTDLLSNISAISLDLPLRVPIYNAYSESPHLQSTLISRRCSHQMTLWLGLYLTPVLPFAVSSLWKIQIPFIQFGLSIVSSFQKLKCGKILDLGLDIWGLQLPQASTAFNTQFFSRIIIEKLIQTLLYQLLSKLHTLFAKILKLSP